MSIRAISEAVGVTPPSIYRHFADKDELILAVCAEHFGAFDEAMEAAAAGVDDPVEALVARAVAYVDWAVANPEHYRILFMGKSMREFSPASLADETIPGVSAFNHLVAAVQRAIDAGAFRSGDDPFLVASAMWSVVHGLASLCITVPGFPVVTEREHLVRFVAETLGRGLRPA